MRRYKFENNQRIRSKLPLANLQVTCVLASCSLAPQNPSLLHNRLQNFICTLLRRREIPLAEKWRSRKQSWLITGQAGTSFVSVSSLVLRGIRLVPTTCFSPQSRCGGSFDLYVAKYHLGKVKMWANAASGLPHLQYVTFGVASRGFTGFQGSLLYMCSVISWSLRIKCFTIANHCGFLHPLLPPSLRWVIRVSIFR